jgi:hypothetical protein
MSGVYLSSLGAINYIGVDTGVADLSPAAGTVRYGVYAVCPLAAAITPTASTIAAWVRCTGNHFVSVSVLWSGHLISDVMFTRLVLFVSAGFPAAVTTLSLRSGGTTVTRSISSTNFNVWQHLCITNNSGTCTLWLNGVSIGAFTGSLPNPSIAAVAVDPLTGQRASIISSGVALWDSVLSPTDIAWLANPANRPAPATGGGARVLHPFDNYVVG